MEEIRDLKILYVEDEQTTRASTEKLLKRFIKEVISAKDGEEALNLYNQHLNNNSSFDLIVSDINMPNINGIDMIKKIRNSNKEIPIVLTTANTDTENLIDSINLNVSQYVLKPINATLLMESLKQAYLPFYQKLLLEKQNKELERLNKKIKEIAKQEIEDLINANNIIRNDDIDFTDFFDNIKVDD